MSIVKDFLYGERVVNPVPRASNVRVLSAKTLKKARGILAFQEASGFRGEELAAEFGMSEGAIYRLLKAAIRDREDATSSPDPATGLTADDKQYLQETYHVGAIIEGVEITAEDGLPEFMKRIGLPLLTKAEVDAIQARRTSEMVPDEDDR